MKEKKNPEISLENRRGGYFAIGLLFTLALVLSMFEWKSYDTETVEIQRSIHLNTIEEEIVPVSQETPPPPPPPPQVTTDIQIVANESEIKEELDIEDMDVDVDTKVDYTVPDIQQEMPEEVIEEEEIFTIVEKMPEFPGGLKALFGYLKKKLKYPAMAKDAGIKGKVYVTFIVDKDGSITNVEVLRGIGGGCDEEAIKVVKEMPKWEPGRQRNKPVRVQYNLPISFILK